MCLLFVSLNLILVESKWFITLHVWFNTSHLFYPFYSPNITIY